ncbi:MAG: GAF domain-containing protein, partial [Halobacteria archaeon]|nr:GAF domain-containing protein [Halobacteria archaeon]
EEERLRQLSKYDLDAFPMRKVLERLTRIAVETFDVETAFVGVVEEDEDRIISCEGLDIETIPREETICSYTILGDTVTTVEDLGSDPRFARSMVRRETDLRSYAGVPLVTLDGHTI